MVFSPPFDITMRLEALNWGFLSPYLRSQTLVLPSLSKFVPFSPLWHLSSKQRASLFHFFYLRTLPLLICGESLMLSLSCLHFALILWDYYNFQPLGIFNKKLWRRSCVVLWWLAPVFSSFFKYKWIQRGKLFFLGKIFLVCVDLMSFYFLHSRTSSISWLNSLIYLIIVRISPLFVFV